MEDIYTDLKTVMEKAHKILILEQNSKQNSKQEKKINVKETKTQSSQTNTTKTTDVEEHKYVSLPPAGRRGTKTDNSIMYWSRSLRCPY